MDATDLKRNDNRPVFEYELPEEMRDKDQYVKKSIGLVKLRMSEEVAASANANNQTKLAYAFLRASLVEIDGRRVNKAEAEDETILEHVDPEIRSLMLEGYSDMATASAGATKKFLASRKVKVG